MSKLNERFVIGNWKMNLLLEDSVALARSVREGVSGSGATEVWVAPSFLAIPAVAEALRGSPVRWGAQTLHGEEKGAWTGEVSASMLREVGGSFCLIGHSERRTLGENDSLLSQKAAGVLRQGITPVYCIGETLEEYERNLTQEVIRIQLTSLFQAIAPLEFERTILAYEPRWAIGTGKVPTSAVIEEVHGFIASLCESAVARQPRGIVYGGSVTPDNAAEIFRIPNVAGGLIGGASLKASQFLAIVSAANGYDQTDSRSNK